MIFLSALSTSKTSTNKKFGGLAQLARASALHAEGHRFDSDILHNLVRGFLFGPYSSRKLVLLKTVFNTHRCD